MYDFNALSSESNIDDYTKRDSEEEYKKNVSIASNMIQGYGEWINKYAKDNAERKMAYEAMNRVNLGLDKYKKSYARTHGA